MVPHVPQKNVYKEQSASRRPPLRIGTGPGFRCLPALLHKIGNDLFLWNCIEQVREARAA